jgi:hypothetical protein
VNLPHKEPLLFAKEILLKSDEKVEVLCIFPMVPTLPMFIEAAAQSSAAFNVDMEAKVGFLTMATDIEFLSSIDNLEYIFNIFPESEVGSYKKFFFVAIDRHTQEKSVQGNFTLAMKV